VKNSRVIPVIEPEYYLVYIQLKILLGNMYIAAMNGALKV